MRQAGSSPRKRIVIIGAGPGGLCAAIKLKEAGFHDLVVLDRNPGVGGTWHHNRYPGAACDIPALLYSFSFALKSDWSRLFATQPEILDYLEGLVERYDLTPHLRLGTAVAALHWDDECLLWRVVTDRGEVLDADVVVSAIGMFNEPRWPDVPGLDGFAGPVVHTARWPEGLDLDGRRVAVIGTAASAVQLVPALAGQVEQLHVFQRTATWVLPKLDAEFTEDQLAANRADPLSTRQQRWALWRYMEDFCNWSAWAGSPTVAAAEESGRAAIAAVEDPEVRAALTPTVRYGCHRPLMSNDWYPTFNRPDVELVTEPIAEVSAEGVVTSDGVEREVDVVVCATGFAAQDFLAAIPVFGRAGLAIRDAWAEGARAYLGIATPGFPNVFMVYGPNTNNGSIMFMIECQVAYLVRQVQRLRDEGLATMEVRAEVADAYDAELQEELEAVEVWHGCSNYWRTPAGRIVTQYPHATAEYRRRTMRPDPEAYAVLPGAPLG